MKLARFKQEVSLKLSFFQGYVQAGFPSPAEDFEDRKVDLNDLLIEHKSATFFVGVQTVSKNWGD
jgi:DNA polymerase V